MRCAACQHENRDGARFCESCGGALARSCGDCGAALSDVARFCPQCGRPQAGASSAEPAPAATPGVEPAPAPLQGERRQLTVMFCDLVGSTELGQRLDPEELREVLAAYQDACSAAVKRFEGHVAQYLGDGVLVYFGYPQAHEDDAERAVRAALAIQASLAELNPRRNQGAAEIEARIGVHTGLVVVGEVGDEEGRQPLALGDTTNVAARLQGVADPGGVVISQTTLRLVAGLFVTRDLGAPALRGVSEPIGVHAVERGAGVGSRLPIRRKATPLAGRELELGQFRDRWEEVQDGRGQVLAVSGEPGIGKSRLIQALRDQLAVSRHTWLEARCSPYTSGSAFQPAVELLETGLEYAEDDGPAERLVKLETGFGNLPHFEPREVVPYLGPLLSAAPSRVYPLPPMGPELQREKTLQALMAPILALVELQPLVLVVEDLHWADPSTLELVERLIDQAPTLPLLLVVTFRPGFQPPWSLARSYVCPLSLSRLTQRQTRDIVAAATERPLPAPVLDEIVSRADGVPLFAEELARSVVDSGVVVESDGRYELRGRASDLSIPTTLQGSLMARLDRLSAAKQVAQLAATLGREFGYGLIEAVADLDVPTLRNGLSQLVAAEILYQRGAPPDASYTFKHALLQDTAYESQLKSRRRELHARIASILEERFPQRVATEPEVMARHCASGGLVAQAITHYQQAGAQAIARLANSEAVEYCGRALELLAGLTETGERRRREIDVRVALAGPLTSLRGYEDPEVRANIQRIDALCDGLGEGPEQLAGLVGLSVYNVTRGDLPRASGYAERILRIAEPLGIAQLRVAGHTIVGSAAITVAPVPQACRHLEQALEIAATAQLPAPATAFDVDILALVNANHAIAMVLDGRPDQARDAMASALGRAEELGHLNTRGTVLLNAAITHYFLDDAVATRDYAGACLELLGGLDFHTSESSALVFRGWARTALGEDEGLAEVSEGIERAEASGSMGGLVQLYLTGADTHLAARRFDAAASLLDRAAAAIERTGERAAFEPQLPMFRAEILLESGAGKPEEIERLLADSVERWRAFESPWMELRSALVRGRLAQRTGDGGAARAQLAELCEALPEGLDIPRMRRARDLLAELG